MTRRYTVNPGHENTIAPKITFTRPLNNSELLLIDTTLESILLKTPKLVICFKYKPKDCYAANIIELGYYIIPYMKKMTFKLNQRLDGTLARTGILSTPHGVINTPAFITVGTAATVKALSPEQVKSTKSQAVLANTYHLYLRPGEDIVYQSKGLHEFMNWQGPIYTDSGGFQVFSLGAAFGKGVGKVTSGEDKLQDSQDQRISNAKKAKIDDDGVSFYSHIDGRHLRLTPEKSMQIQHKLGADIIFAFDECTSPLADYEYQRRAWGRTYEWAKRCLSEHQKLSKKDKSYISLFGVVQGGRHEDLRRLSARELAKLDFDGFGIGGSFNKSDMGTAVKWVCEELPEEKPRHLLGIGEPSDLFDGIENGIDTFDCVSPTRIARNGSVYTPEGRKNISTSSYRTMFEPIDKDCKCYTCQNFSLAYLHHLIKSSEILFATLLTIHNLFFINNIVDNIRKSIEDQSFYKYKKDFIGRYYK